MKVKYVQKKELCQYIHNQKIISVYVQSEICFITNHTCFNSHFANGSWTLERSHNWSHVNTMPQNWNGKKRSHCIYIWLYALVLSCGICIIMKLRSVCVPNKTVNNPYTLTYIYIRVLLCCCGQHCFFLNYFTFCHTSQGHSLYPTHLWLMSSLHVPFHSQSYSSSCKTQTLKEAKFLCHVVSVET